MVRLISGLVCLLLLVSCSAAPPPIDIVEEVKEETQEAYMPEHTKSIYLAGGCFWGVEAYFEKLYGVVDVTSGYANGHTENPSYQDVVTGETGFAETVEVIYDPQKVTLPHLIAHYFRVIDPTLLNRQGNDIGTQYRTGIFFTDPQEREVLEKMLSLLQEDHQRKVVVALEPLENYYLAEAYHQDYLTKNPFGYCHINLSMADELFIPKYPYLLEDMEEKKANLSDAQKHIGLEQGTELPFSHELWNALESGIYVDIVSGQPLFLSTGKYDCGCGWASFHTPADPSVMTEHADFSHGMVRIEVRSALSDLHLGHIFNDGPQEFGGKRYCINGEVIRFIALEDMDEEGYGYLKSEIE